MTPMDPPGVAQMWKALQESHRLPSSDVLSGAEAELQELMRQIDIMVEKRKAEWEKERQALIAKLDVKGNENYMQKSTLDQKHKEIGQLRSELESFAKKQHDLEKEYEQQLGGLREEISRMKKEFEKLHRRYAKKTKLVEADKQRVTESSRDNIIELQRLQSKLEDFTRKSNEWEEKQKKYELIIMNLKKQMGNSQHQKLHGQVGRDKTFDELQMSNNILVDDKAELELTLSQAHDTIKNLEEECQRLNAKCKLERQNRTDQQQLIDKLQQTLLFHSNASKELTAVPRSGSDCPQENQQRSEVTRAETLDKDKALMKNLQDLSRERDNLATQLNELRNIVTNTDLAVLRNQMKCIEAELESKMKALATLLKQISSYEAYQQQILGVSEKRLMELQEVCAQLESVCSKKQSLHGSNDRQDCTGGNSGVNDLQSAYKSSLTSLQALNAKLQDDLISLKKRLKSMEISNQAQLQITNKEYDDLKEKIKFQENCSRMNGLEETARLETWGTKDNLREIVDHYETKIAALQLKITILQDQQDTHNLSSKRIGAEVMKKFANGVDYLLRDSQDIPSDLSDQRLPSHDCSMEVDGELEDDYLTDTVETATAKFLEDQEQRSRELEEQLNNHISQLKSATSQTVYKYAASHPQS